LYFYIRLKKTCLGGVDSLYSKTWYRQAKSGINVPVLIKWTKCVGTGPTFLYVAHAGGITTTIPTGAYNNYVAPTVVTVGPVDEIKTSIYWNPSGICTG
jgi:hypothetical protein